MENEQQTKEAATEEQRPEWFKKRHRGVSVPKDCKWLWLTHAALEKAGNIAGANGVAVYTALCVLESKEGKYKASFPAHLPAIAGSSHLSVRCVQTVLNKLIDGRLVERVSGNNTPGKAEPSKFRIMPTSPDFVQKKGEIKVSECDNQPSKSNTSRLLHSERTSFPLSKKGGRKEGGNIPPSAAPNEPHLEPKGSKGFEGSAENEAEQPKSTSQVFAEGLRLPDGSMCLPIVRRVKTWEELEYDEWLHKQRSQPRAQDGDSGSFTEAEGHDSGEGH
jgi:hypothetical protein